MLVVDFNVANVSTNHHKIPRERNCHWSMLSTRCKISVSDTTLAAWIRCWASPCIWIQMVDQRTFLSRVLHFLQWMYKVQAEFHCLVKLDDVLTKYPGSVTQWVTDMKVMKVMKVVIVTANQGIPTKWFKESLEPGLSTENFKPLIELQFPYMLPLLPAVTCFGILSKRCILEINPGVAMIKENEMAPLQLL